MHRKQQKQGWHCTWLLRNVQQHIISFNNHLKKKKIGVEHHLNEYMNSFMRGLQTEG